MSVHTDFAGTDLATLSDAAAVTFLNKHLNGPLRLLNAHLLHLDSEEGICRIRFEIVPAFCHSGGRICQGGFLTGMVDTAMANAAIVKGKLGIAVPTLDSIRREDERR